MEIDKTKRNWENGFQKFIDKKQYVGDDNYSCGVGYMCGYCSCSDRGKPCVKALNALLKDKGLKVDYNKRSYYYIWIGVGFNRKDGAE